MNGTDATTVIGPDGKSYKFPQGTDKAAAISYFKTKGITGQSSAKATTASATPKTQPPGLTNLPPMTSQLAATKYGLGEAAGGVGDFVKGTLQAFDPRKQPGENALTQLPGYRIGKSMLEPLTHVGELPGAVKDIANAPSPLAALATVGPRAGGSAAAMMLAPEVVKSVIDAVPDAQSLRARAAELNTKALKTAKAGVRDYKLSAGRQVAQDRIVGTVKSLPEKIERVRAAKEAQAMQAVKAADAKGVTINVEQDIKPIVAQATQAINARGLLTQGTINEMKSFAQSFGFL